MEASTAFPLEQALEAVAKYSFSLWYL